MFCSNFRRYGGSGSIVTRVAAATAQKNEGHGWIVEVGTEKVLYEYNDIQHH